VKVRCSSARLGRLSYCLFIALRCSVSEAAIVNRLLEVAEVAEWLGVIHSWVREHAAGRRKPKLPAVKLGDLWKFEKEKIEAFIESCRTK
jgi:excisionase family DNA binding protein